MQEVAQRRQEQGVTTSLDIRQKHLTLEKGKSQIA